MESENAWGRWIVLAAAVGLGAVGGFRVAELGHETPGDPFRESLAREEGAVLPLQPPSGEVHEVELVAAPATIPLLDGKSLEVWAYDGQVPGPTIRARVGDKLRVTLRNRLPVPTTIHWHGLRLPNGMDGVPGVTQPPVDPGGSFVYEFVLPDAGTFWYHPHLRGSEQVERGLHGALVVEPREPAPIPDLVWVLDDWRLAEDGSIDPRFVTRHDLAHDGRWGRTLTVNGRTEPSFELRAGDVVRVRMINAANGRVFRPVFPGTEARVVAIDGIPTAAPLDPAILELAPGNRADVELRVAAGAVTVLDRFGRGSRPLATLLGVGDGPAREWPPFEKAAVPAWDAAATLAPDAVFPLQARAGGPYGIEWSMDGAPMRHDAHDRHPAVVLREGQLAKLRFVNESGRLHPVHLHGQFFRVVARNGAPVNEGHWRDTVLVRPREEVDVALVPQGAGRWVLHCHILEHHDAGMMTLVEVQPEH